jgi:hypothetical protein
VKGSERPKKRHCYKHQLSSICIAWEIPESIIVELPLLDLRQVDHYRPVASLKLEIADLPYGFFHEAVEPLHERPEPGDLGPLVGRTWKVWNSVFGEYLGGVPLERRLHLGQSADFGQLWSHLINLYRKNQIVTKI